MDKKNVDQVIKNIITDKKNDIHTINDNDNNDNNYIKNTMNDTMNDTINNSTKTNIDDSIKNNTINNTISENIDSNKSEYTIKSNDNDTEYNNNNIAYWSKEHEQILSEWADKAMCYKWLHNKSYEKYFSKNTWYTIPVIIMSTITGSANFAVERITDSNTKSMVSMLIGSVNILAGVITTIQQFLKISELNEGHRIAAISWDKFYRNIRLDLAKSPNERQNVKYILKHSKQEFDRLMEISPNIPNDIINMFDKTFSGGKIKYSKSGEQLPLTNKQKIFLDIKKPEICDILETTTNYIYNNNNYDNDNDIGNIIYDKEKKVNDILNEELEKLIFFKQIETFIDKFKCEKNRIPTKDELIYNLQHIIKTEHIELYIISKNLYNMNNNNNNDFV